MGIPVGVAGQPDADAVFVAVFELVTSHPNTVAQVADAEVKVVTVVVPLMVAE